MRKILDILAYGICLIFYPLFVPFYGMILFSLLIGKYVFIMRPQYILFCLLGTSFFTILLPLTAMLLLFKAGKISDMEITDGEQRTIPYICTAMGFGSWTYFLYAVIQMPSYICWTAAGATIALVIVTFINRYWKISAHMIGMGGLLGGVMSHAIVFGQLCLNTITIILVLCLIVSYARLYLNAHTALQIVAGLFLGLICVFIPNYILYHV